MTMPKTYKGKSMRPGGGGRAARMKDKMMRQKHPPKNPGAVIGIMGRKKYGAKKMAKWSAAGRKRGH